MEKIEGFMLEFVLILLFLKQTKKTPKIWNFLMKSKNVIFSSIFNNMFLHLRKFF